MNQLLMPRHILDEYMLTTCLAYKCHMTIPVSLDVMNYSKPSTMYTPLQMGFTGLLSLNLRLVQINFDTTIFDNIETEKKIKTEFI